MRLRPAEGLRLGARGQRPVVLAPNGAAWDAESGQVLINFDTEQGGAARVLVMNEGEPADASIQLPCAYQDAERWYQQALALDPTLADAHHNLAMIYLEIGEEQCAIRHHNEMRRLERR